MTMTTIERKARELLPCPFCGGPAARIDFGPEDAENEGGSCIACTRCQSSGPVEFGRKENFVSNWNRRACVSSATEALRAERDAAFRMSRCECASDECCANLVKHQQRAERLAEAGRRVTAAFRAHGEASSFTRQAERTRHECEAAMLSLADALRDHEQEVGDG